MKLIFNTSNIDNVGVKIFFNDNLEVELKLKGGIYPIELEINEAIPQVLTIELCASNEIADSNVAKYHYMKKYNSELFTSEYKGGSIDGSISNRRWQFSYKTEIRFVNEGENILLVDFIDVNSYSQCAAAIINLDTNATQRFIRRYDETKLKRALLSLLFRRIITTLIICGSIILVFIPLNRMDISPGTFKIIIGILGITFLVPFMFPILMLKSSIDEYHELLRASIIDG